MWDWFKTFVSCPQCPSKELRLFVDGVLVLDLNHNLCRVFLHLKRRPESAQISLRGRFKRIHGLLDQLVSPTELENIILQMPGIADVAVVGIPDVASDEIPRAFVVLRPGANVSEEDIVEYVKPKVAPYKRLAGGVKMIEVIPRNPSGKVLRYELKAIFSTGTVPKQ